MVTRILVLATSAFSGGFALAAGMELRAYQQHLATASLPAAIALLTASWLLISVAAWILTR